MNRPRLALLNASYDDENTPRNFRRELDADLIEIDVRNHDIPENLDVDGCVITGSRASVYWDESWIDPLLDWVKNADERGLPLLGVCYGHQVLAAALGGTVEDIGEYELGYRAVSHSGESRLFEGIPETFTVFTTHSDRVSALPEGAVETAWNDYGNHGFERDNAFAVQFHPEYDMETAIAVTKRKDLPDERIEAVLADITEANYAASCVAKQVFDNFLDIVATAKDAPPLSH